MALITGALLDELGDNETTAATAASSSRHLWTSETWPDWTTAAHQWTAEALGDWTAGQSEIGTGTSATTTTAAPTTPRPCTVFSYPTCDPYLKAAVAIANHGPKVAYAIGVPGSILTIIILCRMRPFNSSSVWLLFLSSADLASLGVRTMLTIAQIHYDYDSQRLFSDWSCKLYQVACNVSEYSAFFFLVGLTVERLIAVWFPLKMSTWCTVRRALAACLLILVLCTTVNVQSAVFVIYSKYFKKCVTRKMYRTKLKTDLYLFLETTVIMAVPVVTIVVLNILIAARLARARKAQKQMSSDQNAKEKDKQQKQINRMLLAASIWFLVCISPITLFNYTYYYWYQRTYNPNIIRARSVMLNLFSVLRLCNHAANFILYVIAARKFRAELIKLVTCNRYKGLFKRNEPTLSKYKSDTKMTGTMDASQSA